VTESLIHALAQLPEQISLELPEIGAREALVARAYGIDGRLRTGPVPAFLNGTGRLDVPLEGSNAVLVDRLDPAAAGHSPDHGDDTLFAGQRIAIVTNVPAPYRHGLFSRMQDRLEAAGASMRVLFSGDGARDRPWVGTGGLRFDYEVMRSLEIPIGLRRPLLPRDLEARLRAFSPTLLLHGGMSPLTAPRAIRYARRTGIPVGIWSGELIGVSTTRGRSGLRRWIFGRTDFGLAYGSPAVAYLRTLYDGPVVIGRNSSAFAPGERARPERPDPVELVTVGDMAGPGKGVDLLVDALALRPDIPCRLTVIGGGTLLAELREKARPDARITFTGPLPHAEVQQRFLQADAFLTPTRVDRFGLALLEAMGAGLAPVTSTEPGLLGDLGVPERTCLIVPDFQPSSWAGAIERIAGDHDLRNAIGDRARRTVHARWSLDHAADAMIAGLRLGVLAPRR
jgi:glycosyltransferase involved in cell wall biosynthesis